MISRNFLFSYLQYQGLHSVQQSSRSAQRSFPGPGQGHIHSEKRLIKRKHVFTGPVSE